MDEDNEDKSMNGSLTGTGVVQKQAHINADKSKCTELWSGMLGSASAGGTEQDHF